MFLHEGPEIHHDEDGYTASCYCGWETETYPSVGGAKKAFNQEHFLAGIDLTPTWTGGPFQNQIICTFCGNSGHGKDTCSRRPLLTI